MTKRVRCIIKLVETGILVKIIVSWLVLLSLLACVSEPSPPVEPASGEPAARVSPDRPVLRTEEAQEQQPKPSPSYRILKEGSQKHDNWPVSYTHLTLPTN